MDRDAVTMVVEAAGRAASAAEGRLLLAVSGGLDSMALLYAMAEAAPGQIAGVATFDHGTGPAATDAADHVALESFRLGLPLLRGRSDAAPARGEGGCEARWRLERLRFLFDAATTLRARVVTAHTEDDQIETVLMRVMRGSGARGLAALAAPGLALRPFVELRRDVVRGFAIARHVRWKEDPSNASRRFLRNRVRHDILPALRCVEPGIDGTLLDVGRRAAKWRAEVDAWVADRLHPSRQPDGSLRVDAAELAGLGEDSLAMVWGALAARVGLRLDRRGTRRVAQFTSKGRLSGRVPLSGGWWVDANRRHIHLRRASDELPSQVLGISEVRWGEFMFRPSTTDNTAASSEGHRDAWTASLPRVGRLVVRSWRPGDRLLPSAGQPSRRVKRYLSEGGVRGLDRPGWPVVVHGEDVLWIPGVRRSDAATERSGRPVRHFLCERTSR